MIFDARNSSRRCTSVTSRAEARQEVGFFHGGIAAADHHDLLAAIEEAVAGGAGTDAVADQLLLRFGRPSQRAEAPEAMISVRVSIHSPSTLRRNGRLRKIGIDHRAVQIFGAEVLAPASSCSRPGRGR